MKGKKVLITGGLGFLGSNLAIRLVKEGAEVTILDNMLEGHGANLFNVEEIKGKIEIITGDVRDKDITERAVGGKEYIFHLAGQATAFLEVVGDVTVLDKHISIILAQLQVVDKSFLLVEGQLRQGSTNTLQPVI